MNAHNRRHGKAEPHCGLDRDGALSRADAQHLRLRNAGRPGEAVAGDAHRLEKVAQENLPGVDVGQAGGLHGVESVVVGDLDGVGVLAVPAETKPVLVVDAGGVLARAVSRGSLCASSAHKKRTRGKGCPSLPGRGPRMRRRGQGSDGISAHEADR